MPHLHILLAVPRIHTLSTISLTHRPEVNSTEDVYVTEYISTGVCILPCVVNQLTFIISSTARRGSIYDQHLLHSIQFHLTSMMYMTLYVYKERNHST